MVKKMAKNRQREPEEILANEPNWGHPEKSQVRTDTSRGERIAGIVWLTIGSLFGLFISVLYVGVRLPVGDSSIPVPWVVIFAFGLNFVISKVALLWTPNRLISGIPLLAWIIGYVVLSAWAFLPLGGDTLVPSSLWSVLLMISGMLGGMWPLLPSFSFDPPTVEE